MWIWVVIEVDFFIWKKAGFYFKETLKDTTFGDIFSVIALRGEGHADSYTIISLSVLTVLFVEVN